MKSFFDFKTGMDRLVRLWNPYVPRYASTSLVQQAVSVGVVFVKIIAGQAGIYCSVLKYSTSQVHVS